MIEFGFTLGMALLVAACAALLSRWFTHAELPSRALRELASTVRLAAGSFASLHLRFLLVALALVAFVLLVAFGLARPHSPADAAASPLETALWVAACFCLGAFSVLAVMRAADSGTHAGSLRLAAIARANLTPLATTALRSAASSAVLAVALPLAAFVLAAFAAWFRFGGLGTGSPVAGVDALKLPWLLTGFALGASLTALSARVLAGIFTSAAAASAWADTQPGLPADHPKHPAWLARTAAASIHHAAGPCSDIAASTSAVCVVSLLLGASVFSSTGPKLGGPVGIITFCPLLIAFGLFASFVGVMVVRADAKDNALRSYDLGLIVALVLSLAGQLACARWIFDAHWLWMWAASAAGLVAGAAAIGVSRWCALPKESVLQALQSAASAGGGVLTIVVLARAAVRAVWLVAAGAVPLAFAYWAAARSGLPGGGGFGLAIATTSMLAPAAYTAAVHGAASQAACASGVSAPLASGRSDSLLKLAELGWWARRSSGGIVQVAGLGVAVSAVSALGPGTLAGVKEAACAVSVGRLEAAIAILLSVTALGVFAGRAMTASWAASEAAGQEIRAHVSSGVRQIDGNLVFTESYDPEHQSCLSMLLHGSARQAIPLELLVLGYGLGVEVALQLLTARWGLLYAAEFMGVALAAAASVGLVVAFALEGGASVWAALERAAAGKSKVAVDEATKRSNNLPHGAAIVSDTVGGPLESMAAPSLQALVRLLVTVTLVLAPLFY